VTFAEYADALERDGLAVELHRRCELSTRDLLRWGDRFVMLRPDDLIAVLVDAEMPELCGGMWPRPDLAADDWETRLPEAVAPDEEN
jgi:hypothetical protein